MLFKISNSKILKSEMRAQRSFPQAPARLLSPTPCFRASRIGGVVLGFSGPGAPSDERLLLRFRLKLLVLIGPVDPPSAGKGVSIPKFIETDTAENGPSKIWQNQQQMNWQTFTKFLMEYFTASAEGRRELWQNL